MPVPLWRLCCLDSVACGLWSPLHSALPAKGDTLADSYAAFIAGPICCHIFCTGRASACPIQFRACQCAGNIATAWSLMSNSAIWFDSYCAIAILFYFLGAYLLLDVVTSSRFFVLSMKWRFNCFYLAFQSGCTISFFFFLLLWGGSLVNSVTFECYRLHSNCVKFTPHVVQHVMKCVPPFNISASCTVLPKCCCLV